MVENWILEFLKNLVILSELSKIKALNCHFELSLESEKSIRILKYALNLWILRYAQYDKSPKFVILSGVRKHKAKNPYFKFMDTSLSAKAQYDKDFVILSVAKNP